MPGLSLADRFLPSITESPFSQRSALLLHSISSMPMSWRKILLDITRIQPSSIAGHTRLSHAFIKLPVVSALIITPSKEEYHFRTHPLKEFYPTLEEDFIPSVFMCSLLSYFVRAECFRDEKQVADALIGSLRTELNAATGPTMPYAEFDYSALEDDVPFHKNWFTCPQLRIKFQASLRKLREALPNSKPLFPKYNRRKNVGDKTAEIYDEVTLFVRGNQNVTSWDLERHYHQTGERIPGPMELRLVWRTNDLKPRAYYANGGDSYAAGCYIRALAYEIQNMLPATHVFTRYDPHRVTAHPLNPNEILVTYDYSSFTTKLSELRRFVDFMADELQGVEMPIVDTYHGLTSIDVGSLLRDYANACIRYNEFDIHRVQRTAEDPIYRQASGGMLGVAGNIGFSTALHGIALTAITDVIELISCVGDDALFRINQEYYDDSIALINQLGTIAPEKFTTWTLHGNYRDQAWKYLKRPLSLDAVGYIETGLLFDLPNIASYLGVGAAYRRLSTSDHDTKVKTVATQFGNILNRIAMYHPDGLEENEAAAFCWYMTECYHMAGLPTTGVYPGDIAVWSSDYTNAYFSAPPVPLPERIHYDWVEELGYSRLGTYCLMVKTSQESIWAPPYAVGGQSFTCTLHRPQKVMIDLGYFEAETLMEERYVDEAAVKELSDFIKGKEKRRPVVRITVLKDPPSWYLDVLHFFHDPIVPYVDSDWKLDGSILVRSGCTT